MPRLPVYEQRTAPNSVGPAPRASGIPVASIGSGLNDLGRAIGGIASDMMRVQEQQREDDAAIAATTSLAEGRLHFAKRLQTLSDEWQEGSPSIYETFEKEYGEWTQKQIEAAGTDRAKNMLRERTAAMRVDFGTSAFKVDRDKRIDLNVGRFDRTVKASTDAVFSDPTQREKVLADLEAGLKSLTGVPEDRKADISMRVMDQINAAAEQGQRAKQGDKAYLAARVRLVPEGATPAAAPAAATETRKPDFNQLFNAVVSQESRGVHQTSDGALLTSPKGARGITQVMPATGQDPGYGIRPLQNESREEYIRFGREYLAAMLKEFGGDTAKALAAYNAGPGRVQDAIKAHGTNWLASMPQETREYVKSIGGKVGMSASEASPPVVVVGVDGQRAEFLPDDQLPPSFLALPFEKRMAILREAEQGARQQTALQTDALRQRLSDATAMAKDGIVDPNPIRPEEFAVLGDKAAAAADSYQRTQVMAQDVAQMNTLPNERLVAIATGKEKRAVAGPGYEAEDARDSVRAQHAANVIKQRTDDPAGYVAKNTPKVAQAWQAATTPGLDAQQRAERTSAAVAQTVAAQRALGISEPRILSRAMLDGLHDRIMKASKPEDAANMIMALEAEYGKQYFPQVMNEMARSDKDLPPAFMILPAVESPAVREVVSRLSVVDKNELKKPIESADVKAIGDAATGYAAELARTMPPVGTGGVKLVNSYHDMIERIAFERLRLGQSSSATDAAESAYKMLLGQFQMADGLRIPRGVDAGAVRSGLRARMASEIPNSLTAADVPVDITRAYKPEEALAQWREVVDGRAAWYTTPDNKGVQLWAKGANGILYRVTRGGQQITLSFDELTRPVAPAAAARSGVATNVQPTDLDAALAAGDMRTYERLKAQQKFEQMKRDRDAAAGQRLR